jgi:hypothetical protein
MVGSRGQPWTGGGTNRRASGCSGALTGVRPPDTPEHGSSPAGVKK